MAHLQMGLWQRVARQINGRASALLADGVAIEIEWVQGHSGIWGIRDARHEAHIAREGNGTATIQWLYTFTSNTARWISKGRSAAKAQRETNKCSEHFSYRLKGNAWKNRPIPMASTESLVRRLYQLKWRHAPTCAYLEQFKHWENSKWWRCWGTVAHTREYLLCRCSRWQY